MHENIVRTATRRLKRAHQACACMQASRSRMGCWGMHGTQSRATRGRESRRHLYGPPWSRTLISTSTIVCSSAPPVPVTGSAQRIMTAVTAQSSAARMFYSAGQCSSLRNGPTKYAFFSQASQGKADKVSPQHTLRGADRNHPEMWRAPGFPLEEGPSQAVGKEPREGPRWAPACSSLGVAWQRAPSASSSCSSTGPSRTCSTLCRYRSSSSGCLRSSYTTCENLSCQVL